MKPFEDRSAALFRPLVPASYGFALFIPCELSWPDGVVFPCLFIVVLLFPRKRVGGTSDAV